MFLARKLRILLYLSVYKVVLATSNQSDVVGRGGKSGDVCMLQGSVRGFPIQFVECVGYFAAGKVIN